MFSLLIKQISKFAFKYNKISLNFKLFITIPRGLTARISGFHPEGPGSTPGVGMSFGEWHWDIQLAGLGA